MKKKKLSYWWPLLLFPLVLLIPAIIHDINTPNKQTTKFKAGDCGVYSDKEDWDNQLDGEIKILKVGREHYLTREYINNKEIADYDQYIDVIDLMYRKVDCPKELK
jgi:hypothetical protein